MARHLGKYSYWPSSRGLDEKSDSTLTSVRQIQSYTGNREGAAAGLALSKDGMQQNEMSCSVERDDIFSLL